MTITNREISFSGVTASYGPHTAISNLDLELEQGFTVLLGPNGCGKTTLFRVGSGILEPDEGTVLVDDSDPFLNPETKSSVSYLPHRPVFDPDLSVRENFEFWGRVQGLSLAEIRDRTETLANRFEFADLLERPGNKLSRGQAQRASIGQALLSDPAVIFLDEATTGLDPLIAQEIRSYLHQLGKERTVVYSTHDLTEANELAERLLIMQNGRIKIDTPMDRAREDVLETITTGFKTKDDEAKAVLRETGYEPHREGSYLVVDLEPTTDTGELLAKLADCGVNITEVKMMDNLVESIYEQVGVEE